MAAAQGLQGHHTHMQAAGLPPTTPSWRPQGTAKAALARFRSPLLVPQWCTRVDGRHRVPARRSSPATWQRGGMHASIPGAPEALPRRGSVKQMEGVGVGCHALGAGETGSPSPLKMGAHLQSPPSPGEVPSEFDTNSEEVLATIGSLFTAARAAILPAAATAAASAAAFASWLRRSIIPWVSKAALLAMLTSACLAPGFIFRRTGAHQNQQGPLSFLSSQSAHALTVEIPLNPTSGVPKTSAAANALKGKEPISLWNRSMYQLDNYLAEDPARMVFVLGAFCVCLTLIGGLVYQWASPAPEEGEEEKPFLESVWTAWTFVADSGLHTEEETFAQRAAGLTLTMGGLIVFSVLVAAVTDFLTANVQALNTGAHAVVESNHVIVSGWTPRTVPLLKELLAADRKRPIVVMGHEDKGTMDEELREKFRDEMQHGAKVVTRTGDPLALEDWERCAISGAHSVVLMSPHHVSPQAADAQLIQASVALSSLPGVKANLVTELRFPANVRLLQSLLSTLGHDSGRAKGAGVAGAQKRTAVAVSTGDLGLRLLLDRALRPETVAVAKELLHCEGHEFHVKTWPELTGKTFGELLFLFKDAVPCGVLRNPHSGTPPLPMSLSRPSTPRTPRTPRSPTFKQLETTPTSTTTASGAPRVLICPPLDMELQEGDQLLVIAEGNDSYAPGPSQKPPNREGQQNSSKSRKGIKDGSVRKRRKVLICGWQQGLLNAFRLLDSCLEKGSTVTILADDFSSARKGQLKKALRGLRHFKLDLRCGDTQDYTFLETLPLEEYDTVLVLSEHSSPMSNGASQQSQVEGGSGEGEGGESNGSRVSPASTTAMLVRSIQRQRGKEDAVLVAELPADQGDVLQELQGSWVSQAVDAEEIEALVLAQIAENPAVGTVLEEIVSGNAETFALEDALLSAADGEELSFWELQDRIASRGKILVACNCKGMGDSWILNPPNKDKQLKIASTDQLIVLG